MKRLMIKSIIASVGGLAALGWFWYSYGWETALGLFMLFYTNNLSLSVVREIDKRMARNERILRK